MVNKPKAIGTATETAVVRFLCVNGFSAAERRALKGEFDEGDITGTPGLCWEVKGGEAARTASDRAIQRWLEETEVERRNANAEYGILVVQRANIGAPNAGRWWSIMPAWQVLKLLYGGDMFPILPLATAPVRLHLETAVTYLRAAGYGDPIEGTPSLVAA